MHRKTYLLAMLAASIIGGLVATTLLSTTQTSSAATSDYFLKIDGVDNGNANGIEVNSWSFGASNSSVATGGGGLGSGVGKVSRKGFTITKELDKTTPLLYNAQVSGKHLKSATFTANTSSGSQLKITMSDVIVSSYTVSGSQGEQPMETVSFSYGKIEFKY